MNFPEEWMCSMTAMAQKVVSRSLVESVQTPFGVSGHLHNYHGPGAG